MPDPASYSLTVDPSVAPSCLPMLVWGEGVDTAGALSRSDWLMEALASAREGGSPVLPATQEQVRAMLRHGAYKPSGRGKPASEYLLNAAFRGEFPIVNGPVDANNAISLASGLPGSIFDAELSGRALLVRYGSPGETYVFNQSGQSINLEDLLVVCREAGTGWEPCGNPVKDSMATKVRAESRAVIGILYAPRSLGAAFVRLWAERYAALLETSCQASAVGVCEPSETGSG